MRDTKKIGRILERLGEVEKLQWTSDFECNKKEKKKICFCSFNKFTLFPLELEMNKLETRDFAEWKII